MRWVVTIDGPAGAGKSTVARSLAHRLGWRLLDTGAMYRAVTLAALRAGIDLSDDQSLGDLASTRDVRLQANQVLLDGEDVSSLIRTGEVTRATKFVANSPSVRRRLVAWQRKFAEENNVIAEGRDQGTVVFPDALCKFYLTASLEERSRRRHREDFEQGREASFETVRKDLHDRDEQDAARSIAPMKPAPDAIVVDTTDLDLEAVVDRIEQEIRERLTS